MDYVAFTTVCFRDWNTLDVFLSRAGDQISWYEMEDRKSDSFMPDEAPFGTWLYHKHYKWAARSY